MIQVKNLEKWYQGPGGTRVLALSAPLLDLGAGEEMALSGPSGSGKTTLLHILAGLLLPGSGQVRVCGHDLRRMTEAARDRFRSAFIGYVFQRFNLLPGLSALENVMAAMAFGNAVPPLGRTQRAAELLALVGLEHRLRHRPGQLSSGEQQRVAVARSLANRPSLVLADEPTASLDTVNSRLVLKLLRELCHQHGSALLVASHDPLVLDLFPRQHQLRQPDDGVRRDDLAAAHGLA
ncbi:MAG: ABC transporter ATP-binding protein [Peptococcaceae bacterium BRH_c4a]|nr:MAG: ABC transporter ATP-binding protein [Peptococcaceae bacterium BRH_c4a]